MSPDCLSLNFDVERGVGFSSGVEIIVVLFLNPDISVSGGGGGGGG